MRVVSWNVNGIRNPFGYSPWNETRSYETIFNHLSADLICLQELKIQRRDLHDDVVAVHGWDPYFTFPKSKKGYSGVAVYCRKEVCSPSCCEEGITGQLTESGTKTRVPGIGGDLNLEPKSAQSIDSEGRALLLDFGLFVIIGTYCPAVTSAGREEFRLSFLEALSARIRNLVAIGRSVIVVGDINVCRDEIDSVDPKESIKNSPDGTFKGYPHRKWLDHLLLPNPGGCLIDAGRHFNPDLKGMYTCWNTKINARPGNYGTRIDYCLASPELLPWVKGAGHMPNVNGSDHCPVYLDLKDELMTSEGMFHIRDLINPSGCFRQGKLVGAVPKALPFCAKNYDEFSSRGSIHSFFSKAGSGAASATLKGAETPKRGNEIMSRESQSDVQTDKKFESTSRHTGPVVKRSRTRSSQSQKSPVKSPAVGHGQTTLTGFVGKRSDHAAEPNADMHGEISSEDWEDVYRWEMAGKQAGESPANRASADAWGALLSRPPKPRCDGHDEECIELTTKKAGPNMGRRFWICPRPVGPGYDNRSRPRGEVNAEFRCGFFKWSSEVRGSHRALNSNT